MAWRPCFVRKPKQRDADTGHRPPVGGDNQRGINNRGLFLLVWRDGWSSIRSWSRGGGQAAGIRIWTGTWGIYEGKYEPPGGRAGRQWKYLVYLVTARLSGHKAGPYRLPGRSSTCGPNTRGSESYAARYGCLRCSVGRIRVFGMSARPRLLTVVCTPYTAYNVDDSIRTHSFSVLGVPVCIPPTQKSVNGIVDQDWLYIVHTE